MGTQEACEMCEATRFAFFLFFPAFSCSLGFWSTSLFFAPSRCSFAIRTRVRFWKRSGWSMVCRWAISPVERGIEAGAGPTAAQTAVGVGVGGRQRSETVLLLTNRLYLQPHSWSSREELPEWSESLPRIYPWIFWIFFIRMSVSSLYSALSFLTSSVSGGKRTNIPVSGISVVSLVWSDCSFEIAFDSGGSCWCWAVNASILASVFL